LQLLSIQKKTVLLTAFMEMIFDSDQSKADFSIFNVCDTNEKNFLHFLLEKEQIESFE